MNKHKNYHQFTKYYKINQEIICFIRIYIGCHGETVASELSDEIYLYFGVRITYQWVNVIVKSAGLPQAKKGSRRRKSVKENRSDIQRTEHHTEAHAGLILGESLFMQGAGKTIANTIQRRNSSNFIKNLGNIFLSGIVDRLSNYESGDIPEVNVEGTSMSNAINDLVEQDIDVNNRMNETLLNYWVEQEVSIKSLYADGNTKQFYTSRKSLCGKISCGGVAPGTRSVLIGQEEGLILWLQMHRIDEHLGEPFIRDTNDLLDLLPAIENCVPLIVDREGSGSRFTELSSDYGIPLITMLKPSSYKGLQDFVGDLENPGFHKWASPNKSDDSRRFYLHMQKDKLIVFSVNITDPELCDKLKSLYKNRWNASENPIRTLNQYLSFGKNVGQKVYYINSPKQIKEKDSAKEKLPILEQRLEKEKKKNPRLETRKLEKLQNIQKLDQKINKARKIIEKPLEKVAVKDTKADHFVGLIKVTLFNLVLYLLMSIGWRNINAQEVGFVFRSIIRRRGRVKHFDNMVEIALKRMHRKSDRYKQEEIIAGINKLKYYTTNGKLIKLKIDG